MTAEATGRVLWEALSRDLWVGIRKETWDGRQRRKCKEFYSTQVPIYKDLQNLVLKCKIYHPTIRSWRGADGGDKHFGPTLPQAGFSGSEG